MIKVKIASAEGKYNLEGGGKTKYFNDWIGAIRNSFTYEEAQDIAAGAVDAMKKKLNSQISRNGSTGTLAESLKVTASQNQYGFQFHVGDVNIMPDYWYVINYGKRYDGEEFIPPSVTKKGKWIFGSFEGNPPWPSTDDNTQRWMVGTPDQFGKKHRIVPQKPVEGKHFIEAGERYIRNRLARLADRRFKTFKRTAKKKPNPTKGEESE